MIKHIIGIMTGAISYDAMVLLYVSIMPGVNCGVAMTIVAVLFVSFS